MSEMRGRIMWLWSGPWVRAIRIGRIGVGRRTIPIGEIDIRHIASWSSRER